MNTYTLTGAADWPMLVATLKLAAWIIGGLLGLNAALLAAMWWDFRQQFSKHKDDEATNCRLTRLACKDDHRREFGAIWEVLDLCCPREAAKARAQIQTQQRQEVLNAQ